jgi:hypothetical protein
MELMIALAVFALIVPVMVVFLSKSRELMASDEALNQLKTNAQTTLTDIHNAIEGNVRIIDATQTSFFSNLNLSGAPVSMTGTTLPTIDAAVTAFSPTDPDAVSADWGNSLMFLTNTSTDTFQVVSSSGVTDNVAFNVDQINYYYLTPNTTNSLSAAPSYKLIYWTSVPMVDYGELSSSFVQNDPAIEHQAVSILYNVYGVTHSLDFSNGNYYALTSSEEVTNDPHTIKPNTAQPITLTTITNGILSGGFEYGIACNSNQYNAGWSSPVPVPEYATVTGNFPGGFEVGIFGNPDAREVFIRIALVAQGAFPGLVYNDLSSLSTVWDAWSSSP